MELGPPFLNLFVPCYCSWGCYILDSLAFRAFLSNKLHPTWLTAKLMLSTKDLCKVGSIRDTEFMAWKMPKTVKCSIENEGLRRGELLKHTLSLGLITVQHWKRKLEWGRVVETFSSLGLIKSKFFWERKWYLTIRKQKLNTSKRTGADIRKELKKKKKNPQPIILRLIGGLSS